MTELKNFPPLYRIRSTSGPLAGNWLWMMTVSKNGVPFQVVNWDGVLQHPEQYTIYPQFIPSESAAFLAISRDVAESFVHILTVNNLHCEVVEVKQSKGRDLHVAQPL